MNTTVQIQGVTAPTGRLERARIYNPDGSTNSDFALTEIPAGSGVYEGSAVIDLPDSLSAQYQVEVREVAAQTNGNFSSSIVVRLTRGNYDGPGGYLKSGMWFDNPQAIQMLGAYRVTATVLISGSSPLQNAIVRLSFNGSDAGILPTDVNGLAVIPVGPGTYDWTVIAAGYIGQVGSIVVTSDCALNVSITSPVMPSNPDPLKTNAFLWSYDGQGNIMPNVNFTFRMIKQPVIASDSFSQKSFSKKSDQNGYLTVELARNASYMGKRSNGNESRIDTDGNGSYALPQMLD